MSGKDISVVDNSRFYQIAIGSEKQLQTLYRASEGTLQSLLQRGMSAWPTAKRKDPGPPAAGESQPAPSASDPQRQKEMMQTSEPRSIRSFYDRRSPEVHAIPERVGPKYC